MNISLVYSSLYIYIYYIHQVSKSYPVSKEYYMFLFFLQIQWCVLTLNLLNFVSYLEFYLIEEDKIHNRATLHVADPKLPIQ